MRGMQMPVVRPDRRRVGIAWIAMILLSVASSGISAGTPARGDAQRRAALATDALQAWYSAKTGLYRTTGWWNSANAITALADESRVSGSKKYWPVFSNTLTAAQRTSPGFLNNFYDDEGWWALAWIDVYDLTRDGRYLAMAESIFKDMAGGWDSTCAGGIWWSKDRKYKNAIANELFLRVAAALANRTVDAQRRGYLEWAEREWHWFRQSGMINGRSLINDGLSSACVNNGETEWSYNQGVILGGLAELWKSNGDAALLAQAEEIAGSAMTALTDAHGILHDACEPKCGADGTQFKGILVRNLRILDETQQVRGYEHFIFTNAGSVWAQTQGKIGRLGPQWAAPFGAANASSESSALDLLVAASALSERTEPAGTH